MRSKCEIARSTFFNKLRELVADGLVIKGDKDRLGRVSYGLDYVALSETRDERTQQPGKARPATPEQTNKQPAETVAPQSRSETPQSRSETPQSRSETPQPRSETRTLSNRNKRPITATTAHGRPIGKAAADFKNDLGRLLSDVARAGVKHPRKAVDSALAVGVSVVDLRCRLAWSVDHASANDWGPGALADGLKNTFPGQAVEAGWPKHLPAAASRDAAARAERERLHRLLADQARKKREAADAAEHEATFGPVLDAMTDLGRRQLLAEIDPRRAKRLTPGQPLPDPVRRLLLLHLERQADAA